MVEGLPLLRGGRTNKSLLNVLKDVHHRVLCQGLGCLVLGEQVVDEAKGADAEKSPGKVPPDGIVCGLYWHTAHQLDVSNLGTSLDKSAVSSGLFRRS